MKQADDFFTADAIEDLDIQAQTPVNIIKAKKIQIKNEFVMMFVENFQRLVPVLSKTEMRVLLSVLKFMNYQNVFNITQRAISADAQISTANVSRAMKSLKERNILAETENGIGYINPLVFSKGHILETKKNIKQMALVFSENNLTTDEIKNPY